MLGTLPLDAWHPCSAPLRLCSVKSKLWAVTSHSHSLPFPHFFTALILFHAACQLPATYSEPGNPTREAEAKESLLQGWPEESL